MQYDYIIVGAGPSGLTTAWLLAKNNKKCLIIDREETIGGCHRVHRDQGYFSEHGPRIYLSNYVNTKNILHDMTINFDDIFTPMPVSFTNIGGFDLWKIPILDIIKVIMTFILFLIYPYFAETITVKEYFDYMQFDPQVKIYFDRFCRTTDGVGADKYTLYQFLELVNQYIFVKYYQPKEPNDILLFPKIKEQLDKTHNIDFMLNNKITKLNHDNNQIINIITHTGNVLTAKNYIFAIPPKNLFEIMPENAFPLNQEMINDMSYNTYITITFHWKNDLQLKPLLGFGNTTWGLIFFVLSNYIKFKESKTVISSSISILDEPSDYTKKTANQSTKGEIIQEAFRQLKLSYPDLPNPDYITNEHIEFENNQWVTYDGGYIRNKQQYTIDFKSPKYENLYTVGTQNGHADFAFTSFESAVTNAIIFCNQQEPIKFSLSGQWTIRNVLILIIVIVFYIYYFARS